MEVVKKKIKEKTYEIKLFERSISVISAGLQSLNSVDFSRDDKLFFLRFSFFNESIFIIVLFI